MAVLWLLFIPLAYCGQIHIWSKLTHEENIKLMKTCGGEMPPAMRAPTYKLFDGAQVEPNAYPFAVAAYSEKGLCTGVLISKRHVLTAQHCVVELPSVEETRHICRKNGGIWPEKKVLIPKKLFKINAGSKCPHFGPCASKRLVYNVSKISYHPSYNECTDANDLAIMELSQDVDENDAIPICLPKLSTITPKELKAIGYGLDPFDDNTRAPALQVTTLLKHKERKGKIIAYDKAASVCQGDSGGPLFFSSKGRSTLLGITSVMSPGCLTKDGKPYLNEKFSHFIDVREHLDWICETTGVCSTQ